MAKKAMKHLNLFPAGLPKDEAMIVINGIRGVDDGHTGRDRAEAAWWVAGYGLSFIPEGMHTAAGETPLTEEEAADILENAVRSADSEGMKAIPWALLWPIILQLALKWFS